MGQGTIRPRPSIRIMPKRALVTGASGFLGGHVVADLASHGYDVIAAGRNADALRLAGRDTAPWPHGVETFVGDLEALAQTDVGADVVVHCAALSSPWGPWADFERANVDGTRRMLELARRVGARRLVHISSPGVYAAPRDRIAIREDDVDERRPMNDYIRSKLEAEALLRAASQASDAPEIVMLRPRGIIGRGDPSLVPRMLAAYRKIGIPLIRGGRGLVDLTSVENVALAVRLAAEAPAAAVHGEAINITNGDPRPFGYLIAQLLSDLDLPPRYLRIPAPLALVAGGALERVCAVLPGRPEPPMTRYTVSTISFSQTLDITKARDLLGYAPIVTLDETLAGYARG